MKNLNGDDPGAFDAGNLDSTEALVRAALVHRAKTLPQGSPPVELLRRRGRRRRRLRDAMTGTGTLALIVGTVVGVRAATAAGHGPSLTAAPAASTTAAPLGGSATLPVGAPRGWKPGPEYVLPSYPSIFVGPALTESDAQSGIPSLRQHGHPMQSITAGSQDCLTLGSSPVLWPAGYYLEGTPQTVFDRDGRAVYVVDKGFTGLDGEAMIAWPKQNSDGTYQEPPGAKAANCGDIRYAVLIVFPGGAKS